MIKISGLRYIPEKIASTKFLGVTKAHLFAIPKSLEASPIKDTLIKTNPQNFILGSNPKKLIKEITSVDTSAIGKDAAVFQIPNQDGLVLRVEQSALEKLDQLSDNLKLIPIKHKPNVLAHDNLGLPLYSVIDKDSQLYTRQSILPTEALAQKDNIMVLKKVTGKHPAVGAYNALMKLMGVAENEPNVPQYINFHQLTFIRGNYGKDAAKECLRIIKQGGEQNIPENYFMPGSDSFTFVNCDTFKENYANYVKSYIDYLKDVSKMPKKSFKEAVDTILMDKDFLIDFQHTNNTFVDLPNKKFNFMDFEYDKTNAKYIYDNPVKEFRNVLLGKCFSKPVSNPAALLLEEKDANIAKKYMAKITEKVNSVTPDEYKF